MRRRAAAGLRGEGAGPPGGMSRWAWAADMVLAVFLAAITVEAAWKGSQYVGDTFQKESVVRRPWPGVPYPPDPPDPPDPLAPPDPSALPGHVIAGQPPGGHPGIGHPIAEHLMGAAASPSVWVLVLAALTALPLVVRRRFPLSAFWSVLLASIAFHLADRAGETDAVAIFTFVSCLIAAYSAAMYNRNRRAMVRSLIAGGLLVIPVRASFVPGITPGFLPFLLLVPLGLAANTLNSWRQRMASLEAEQEAATRRAVEQERARIARELHDVVTHNVSMMTVQAGAARKVMDSRPDMARDALLAVEAGGRAAMSELRHVMGLLTMPEDAGGGPGGAAAKVDLAPQPGLGQLDALAGRARDAGVDVTWEVTGDAVPLPPGVDLAAYRVVQEALTNAVKHAAGAAVRIRVRYAPGELRVEVADTGGTASPTAATGNARGLIGLRERLAVYGGTLDAGRRISGGYRVSAVLPVVEA